MATLAEFQKITGLWDELDRLIGHGFNIGDYPKIQNARKLLQRVESIIRDIELRNPTAGIELSRKNAERSSSLGKWVSVFVEEQVVFIKEEISAVIELLKKLNGMEEVEGVCKLIDKIELSMLGVGFLSVDGCRELTLIFMNLMKSVEEICLVMEGPDFFGPLESLFLELDGMFEVFRSEVEEEKLREANELLMQISAGILDLGEDIVDDVTLALNFRKTKLHYLEYCNLVTCIHTKISDFDQMIPDIMLLDVRKIDGAMFILNETSPLINNLGAKNAAKGCELAAAYNQRMEFLDEMGQKALDMKKVNQ